MIDIKVAEKMLERLLDVREKGVDYVPWLWWCPVVEGGRSTWSVLVYMRGLEGVSDVLYRFFTFDVDGDVVNYAEGNAGRFLPEDLMEGYEKAEDKWEFMEENYRRISDFLVESGLIDEVGIELYERE